MRTAADRDAGYDPSRPLSFDLLRDAKPPHAEAHPDGGAIVRLYGDLKRHSMGRRFVEPDGPSASLTPMLAPLTGPDDEPVMVDPEVFMTAELWGVGNTGPWLHDGRAGTLHEAVVLQRRGRPSRARHSRPQRRAGIARRVCRSRRIGAARSRGVPARLADLGPGGRGLLRTIPRSG